MRLQRTLIATAVTFASVGGTIAFAETGPPVVIADPMTSFAAASSPRPTGEASPPIQPAGQVGVRAVSVPPVAVDVPDGASPLAVDLAPIGADSTIATGAEAARWLEETSPEVRRDVADNVGVDLERLSRLFLDDPTAFLAPDGMVGYLDPAPPGGFDDPHQEQHSDAQDHEAHAHDDAGGETSGVSGSASSTLIEALGSTPADVFALHSLPSSTKVIYLDFDGHQMENEYWNSRFSIGPYTNNAYDIDGDPASFSATEKDRIYEIFQRVADDYAPFDIDVTTQDPGIDGLRRTSTGDTSYGVRVVITSSDWYATASGGTRIGGIALLDVFTANADHVSYVFSRNLGSGNAKYVADATSHEAGHTLSLDHDGTSTAAYYAGHGDWGPIMGTPYRRAVTQWSNGQYPDADNTKENDLAAIGARGGYRVDDHGDDAAEATAVTVGTRSGLIGVGDVDVFRFAPTGSSTLVSVSTPAPGTNLLARMIVRDEAGNIVTQVDPSVASGWALTTEVPASAGAFTVEVAPTSWQTFATGFPIYGSLGAYTISFTSATTTTTATTPTTTSSTTSPTTATTVTTTTVTTTTTTSTPPTSTTTSTTTTTPKPSPSPTTTLPPAPASPRPNGFGLTAIAPRRLVDTRVGLGGQTRQPPGGVVRVPIAGSGEIPADARAVVANITIVGPDAAGFATVYPCTAQVPDVSVLNHAAGQTVANGAIATLAASGDVCVYTYAGADILLDVTGWLGPSGASRMVPIGPTRTVDTRSGIGGARRVGAGSTTVFDLRSALPPGSTAVAVNLTAVSPAAPGFMTAFPCGRTRPETSSLNFAAGETRPNNAIVATDDGTLCVYSDTAADILVDVTAAFGPNGLGLVPVDPVRVLDTRRTAPFGRDELRAYSSLGATLSPAVPRSASVNVTALDQPAAGFVTTFDCVTLRDTSTLNPTPGTVSANGAIVPLADGDRSCLMSSTGGNLIVDLNGWWMP